MSPTTGALPRDPGPSEDWTVPLIPGRAGGDLAGLLIRREPSAPLMAVQTVPPVRCAVATGVLDAGGLDEFVAFLGRGLPRLGLETVVVYEGERLAGYTGAGGRLVRELTRDGVPLVRLSAGNARSWLASYRPDVISAHGAPDWLLTAAAAQGVPWVETLHGMHTFLDPATGPAEKVRARAISAQIAVSELVREQYLLRNPAFPPERIVTITNGIDDARIHPVSRMRAREALGLRDEFVFLSLARYGLQKNTYGLVTAFAEVARDNPDAHLLIAGRADDPMYFQQVRKLTATLPCVDRIHLRGHCGSTPALLAAADAFVLDSFFEGWSLASMEAIKAGLPVVLSDVGGAREQLTAVGMRGHLIANPGGAPESVDWSTISELRFRPQGNKDELVAAMSKILLDRERWAKDRDRLRRLAAPLFSADDCLRRHASVLAGTVSVQVGES
jgi:glycosyltransferase involved in cell wall biosynthesis